LGAYTWIPPAVAVASLVLAVVMAIRTIYKEAKREDLDRERENNTRHTTTEQKVRELEWRVTSLEHLTHPPKETP
jgi:hypothetical protein